MVKSYTLLFVFCVALCSALAQSSPKTGNQYSLSGFKQANRSSGTFIYNLSVSAETYSNLEGAISVNNGEIWDDPEYLIPIPFPFNLNGNDVAFLGFSGLGFTLGTPTSDPDIITAVLPFETDLIDRGDGTGTSESPISYLVEGTPGSRIMKLEIQNAGSYYDPSLEMFVNVQLWLYEGSNKIEFHYGPSSVDDPGIFYDTEPGALLGVADIDFENELIINPHFIAGNVANPFLSVFPESINGTPTNGTVYTLSLPLDLELTVTGENSTSVCSPNGTATAAVSGGIEPYTYLWSNGEMTATINNLSGGTYSVTVTDDDGNSANGSVSITQPGELSANAESTDETALDANDGTATSNPAGGTPPYSYEWINGSTDAMITDLAPGMYTVTVTDSEGCNTSETVTVNPFGCGELSIEGGVIDINCFGECEGSAEIIDVQGGTAPYSFEWSNNGVGPLIDNLCAGTYTVTATDAQGCAGTAEFVVGQPDQLIANAGATNETGENANDGTAWSAPTGGTPPYTYEWSTGGTDSLIVGLAPGEYRVTVTDANGCTDWQAVQVDPFDCGISMVSITFNSCYQSCDGSIEVFLAGAVEPVTYMWTNGADTSLITDLCAGDYSLTATDAEGCTVTATFTILQPDELLVTVDGTNETSEGANDGTAMAIPVGGTPPYSYEWSNGSTDEMITGLAPDIYFITVTDANGCADTQAILILPFVCIQSADAVVSGASCFEICDGSVDITSVTGAGPFSFNWSTGDTTATLEGLCAGPYSVTITDEGQGCSTVFEYEIAQPEALSAVVDEVVHLTDSTSTAIAISVSGGVPPYAFAWTGPAGFADGNEDLSDVSPGFYSVVVTDANGCNVVLDSVEVRDEIVGVRDVQTLAVRFYPNPATDLLHVDLDATTFEIELLSIDGVKQHSWKNSVTLDLGLVPAGMYIIKIVSGDKSSIDRLMITQ